MKKISRRTFLSGTAAAAGAFAAGGLWHGGFFGLAHAETPDYFASQFGIGDELCRKVLAKALSKGGDFADLFFEHTVENWVALEDGKVNKAYGNVDLGVGIRTVKGDQIGYGFTQELTEESMMAAASTAATIADASAKGTAEQFILQKHGDFYPTKQLWTQVPLSSKLPFVQSLNDKCFALSPLIVKVKAAMNDRQRRILVVTSDGVKAEDLQPKTYLYASVVAEKDGRREKAWWNLGGRKGFSFYTVDVIDEIAREAVGRAVTLFEAQKPPAGEMPVVLGPGVTGILLHESIGHGMEADFNRKKISTYADMIGRKVAEPFVTILDDGTNPHQLGSINVDDEANPAQKTVLVENGIMKSYLHSRISARHYKVAPTGNGRRQSYQYQPIPRMRNTYMLPGPASPADVIKSVKKGIFVQDVSNGQVKIGEGDFAFYVSQGRLIEDGKLTAPIKDVNIIGNGPKMLRDFTMVANDLELSQGGAGHCGKSGQWVPVSFGLPTVLVKSLNVGGVSS